MVSEGSERQEFEHHPGHLLSRDDIERETGGGITRRWLELAAHQGSDGPPYVKVGRRTVRYRRADFEAWLASRTVTPEAEAA